MPSLNLHPTPPAPARETDRSPVRDPGLWDSRYRQLGARNVSWAQRSSAASLDAISVLGVPRGSSVIDVGGGTSPFAAELHDRGFGDVTVLDISSQALAAAQHAREDDSAVRWVQADLLAWQPERRYDVWHDRALFHFLTGTADRARYREVLADALAPGGYVIVEAFANEGPASCSGLPVRRYGPVELHDALEPVGLRLERYGYLAHTMPRDARQEFVWAGMRRVER